MEGTLHLEVATTKPRYGADEEVAVRVYLFNFGDDPIGVNSRFALNRAGFPGEVSLEVVGPTGKAVPFTARVSVGSPDASEDLSLVVPWSCVGRQFELGYYYDLERPGRYTIRATYSNQWTGPDPARQAWTGTLRSEPVSFEIESE